jgi:hypothetical protein
MTPSISARIDSMIQAMDDIVLPAIEADKNLAREQAQLVVAHLHLIKKQLAHADAFDRIELASAVQLGLRLIELTKADPGVASDRQTLKAAISEGGSLPDRQDAIRAVNGATETFVRALRQFGERGSIDAMTSTVLSFAQEQSRRNLIWFASNGFDAERDSLPSIESMFV